MQPAPQDLMKQYVQSQHFTSTSEIMQAMKMTADLRHYLVTILGFVELRLHKIFWSASAFI
jgi:hypothetical protein